MPKTLPVSAQVLTTAQTVSVTAAPSSTGTAFPYTSSSSSVSIVNTSIVQDSDVAYQLNSNGWAKLGKGEGVTLEANLASDKIYLRRIGANNGAVEVSVETAPAITAPSAPLAPMSASLSILALKDYRPFFEVTPGVYVLTNATNGQFGRQLCTFTGDIVTGVGTYNTSAKFSWHDTTSAQGLYSNDGGTILGGANAIIYQVWKLASGAMLMLARAHDATAANGLHYIHRVAANFDCGTSANNRRASLHVGSLNGTVTGSGTIGIHGLHQRSLCEVIVGSTKTILFAEYNVASGRVTGGSKDQIIVWKSTDDGVSFSKFLEFNTDGTHRFSHCHAVIQNPYTRLVYFLMGDTDSENAIISWDGVSAAPIANATLAQIAATPGWAITSGDELRRYGDLVFTPDGRIYGLPDSDYNIDVSTKGIDAFTACSIDPSLKYVSNGTPFTRQRDICPLIALRCSNGAMVYGSLRTTNTHTDGPTTIERYHHFWTSVDGINWAKAARIYNYNNTATGNVLDLWQDSFGNVIAGGMFARGSSWGGAARTASCAIFRTNLQYGAPSLVSDV